MSDHAVDCQGLPCPQPVLRCKSWIESHRPHQLSVLVDNEAAKENVSRFLRSQGYDITRVTESGGQIRLHAERRPGTPETGGISSACVSCNLEHQDARPATRPGKTLVLLTSATIGRGDDILGARLMANFLATLPELGEELWRIILLNGAVRLAVADSPVLDALQTLAGQGVSILVCGTCLDYFGLLEQKAVGETTNMLDVVTSLQNASSIMRP